MSKIVLGLTAAAVLSLMSFVAPASAATKQDGVGNAMATAEQLNISARRYRRHHHYGRHHYYPRHHYYSRRFVRPYYGGGYYGGGYYGGGYGYGYNYNPYYRPYYYRPYYYRPGPFFPFSPWW